MSDRINYIGRKIIIYIICSCFLFFGACNFASVNKVSSENIGSTNTELTITEKVENILLKSAPEISLTDSLSSSMNTFNFLSGNYSWNYLDGEEVVRERACGSHPLDIAHAKDKRLELPDYNMIDYVPYLFTSSVKPDKLIVNEWDISKIGDLEAIINSTESYEDTFILNLQPDKVYELIAIWNEDNYNENGFYGEASYVVVTQKK